MTITRDDVAAALAKIVDPGQGKDLISAGMAKAIMVSGGNVGNCTFDDTFAHLRHDHFLCHNSL
jgi:hypothetical protein